MWNGGTNLLHDTRLTFAKGDVSTIFILDEFDLKISPSSSFVRRLSIVLAVVYIVVGLPVWDELVWD